MGLFTEIGNPVTKQLSNLQEYKTSDNVINDHGQATIRKTFGEIKEVTQL